MTILQSLNRYYDRMAARGEAEQPGFSREKISFTIVLSPGGDPLDVLDRRVQSGKRLVPSLLEVPAAAPRRSNILSNLFWDKTEYSLGRSAEEDSKTPQRHAAFKDLHRTRLGGRNDPGLAALLRFLEGWDPAHFNTGPFTSEMLDTNFTFRLDGDAVDLHLREAAQALLAEASASADDGSFCLVTGRVAPTARLHPTVKGVQGAQTAGAQLVSFNLDAFTSYGKEQGANAPTSEAAAFRYGSALNRMLDRDSGNRLQRLVGDATVAFWADASDLVPEESAKAAEDEFAGWFDPPPPVREADAEKNLEADEQERAKLRDTLEVVAAGRPQEVNPKLRPGTRFHVLGLAPNAARLSVRYWLDDTFEVFARRLADHAADMRIEPPPRDWGRAPALARLLVKTTALQDKFDNIPPLLAGELTRAVLGGTRYPQTLLAAALMRLRAGDDAGTGWHAAVIRGMLERDRRLTYRDKGRRDDATRKRPEVPMTLDRSHANAGYQLGRLFAVYELAQVAALGRGVKSTIRDKYFGAASATPASIFGVIISNGQNHLAKVRKEKPGWAVLLERELEEVMGRFEPRLPHTFPRSLRPEDQGEFAIGYYHQRKAKLGDGKTDQPTLDLNQGVDGDDD